MAPRLGSRFTFCRGVADDDGVLSLTDREPYEYRELSDTRTHRVVEGDSLFTLAAWYFRGLPRAAGYWWVIADFQPDRIIDGTLVLDLGRVIYIPSMRVLTDVILAEARRKEHG